MGEAGAGPEAAAALARITLPVPPTKPSALRRLDMLARSVPEAADTILLGDSLAASWPEAAAARLAGGRVFPFGLPGDRIGNTLWRLDGVDTAHLRPSLCLLLLGTNNLGDGNPPQAIVAGLMRVLERADALWTPKRIVIVGLPWRRPVGRVRDRARRAVNAGLREAVGGDGRLCLDPDPVLGAGAARTGETVSADGLHLTPAAYRRLTDALVGPEGTSRPD